MVDKHTDKITTVLLVTNLLLLLLLLLLKTAKGDITNIALPRCQGALQNTPFRGFLEVKY